MKLDVHMNWNEKPSQREKITFFVTLLIFCIVFLRACILPTQTNLSEGREKLLEMKREKSSLVQFLAVGQKKPEKIDMRYAEWGQATGEMPDALLMRDLSHPSLLRGLTLVSVSFEEPQGGGGLIQQKWKAVVSGSFALLQKYLQSLENLHLLVVIDTINIQKGEQQGHIKAQLEGIVYGWK